jgi:hypothetical protein
LPRSVRTVAAMTSWLGPSSGGTNVKGGWVVRPRSG